MDAKTDEMWRVGYNPGPVVEKRFRGSLWNIVDTDEIVVALNALQQQLADAEAKAAHYEALQKAASDLEQVLWAKQRPAVEEPLSRLRKALGKLALNPHSPITPGEAQG